MPRRDAARPRRRRARALDLRPGPRRADAAARARRRRLLAAPAPGPALRHGRDAAGGGEPRLLPLGDPLRRAARPTARRSAARRRRRSSSSSTSPTSSRPSCATAVRARRARRSRRPRSRSGSTTGGVAEAWLESEPHAHMLVEELMILANEQRRRVPRRRGGARRSTASTSGPTRRRSSCCSRSSPTSRCRRRRCPSGSRPSRPPRSPARPRSASPSTSSSPGAGARRSPRSSCARSSRRGTTREPRPLGAREPAYCHFTSPIRRYPDLVVHRALLRELGLGDDPRPTTCTSSPSTPRRASARRAARVPRRRHLPRVAARGRLHERGWDEPWEGEITGLIGSGLFVRFGEVFEGFLPARRLPGEFFELNPPRHGARRPATGRVPARRPDRRARRVDRAQRGARSSSRRVRTRAANRGLTRLEPEPRQREIMGGSEPDLVPTPDGAPGPSA